MEYIDLTEEQLTKKQHYVPKTYLKEFSCDNQKTPHVYALFPNAQEPVRVSIEKICCQLYLYEQITVDSDNGAHVFAAPNELERFFSTIEGRYATIIAKLKSDLQEKNDFKLEEDEINALKGFISLQISRNPIFVHISNVLVDKFFAQDPEYIEHIQNELPDIPPNVLVSYLAHRVLKEQLLISILAWYDTMDDSQICIFKTTDSSFITSSTPVCNIFGERDGIKYDLAGMPITPNLFLAFVDVDIPIPNVVTIDECSAKRINHRQLGGEKNILISNRKDLLSLIDFSFEVNHDDDFDSWFDSILSECSENKETFLRQYNEIMNTKEVKYWR